MPSQSEIDHRLRIRKLPELPSLDSLEEPDPDAPALEKFVCWKLTCYICRRVEFVEAMKSTGDTLTKLDLHCNVLYPLQPMEPEQPDRYVCKDCSMDPERLDLLRRIQTINNNAIGKQNSSRWFDGGWEEHRAWLERMLWVHDALRRNEHWRGRMLEG